VGQDKTRQDNQDMTLINKKLAHEPISFFGMPSDPHLRTIYISPFPFLTATDLFLITSDQLIFLCFSINNLLAKMFENIDAEKEEAFNEFIEEYGQRFLLDNL
jgi:hypothetical protein